MRPAADGGVAVVQALWSRSVPFLLPCNLGVMALALSLPHVRRCCCRQAQRPPTAPARG
jgi:hypothetical protein